MSLGRVIKRGIDLLGALVCLIALSPLFLIIAILIKVTSPGTVFYRWKVVGRNGAPFTSYKFRSMYQDAERRKAELLSQNEMQGPVFKIADDPRITPVGRVLRKYSLDELPQLWSVLKGDMSLVGPRPPLQSEFEEFTDFQKGKLRVRPGITCLWQISGRNEIRNFDNWVKLDMDYIQNWSLWLDLKILMRTIRVVILGTGR